MRSRVGFTAIELILALSLSALLAGMAFALLEVGSAVQRQAWRRADAEGTRRSLELVLRGELRRAARTGISSPNLGVVRVLASGIAGAEEDELVVLSAAGSALGIASRGCRSGAVDCLVLLHDQTAALEADALLAVGSAAAGYRVLQLRGDPRIVRMPCGAECSPELLCALDAATTGVVEGVIRGVGPGDAIAPSCEESHAPNGDRCLEVRGNEAIVERRQRCTRRESGTLTLTEADFIDRTEVPLGYPGLASWSPVSGNGAAAVAAVPVTVTRLRTVPEKPARALVRERGLTGDGRWNAPLRVAGPLTSFRVETLDESAVAWQRGDGFIPGMLDVEENPNREEPPYTAGAEGLGYSYLRGYHTLVGVRIRADVVGRASDGTPRSETVWVLSSLIPSARGGAREGR